VERAHGGRSGQARCGDAADAARRGAAGAHDGAAGGDRAASGAGGAVGCAEMGGWRRSW